MSSQATLVCKEGEQSFVTPVALNSGDIVQLPDGRASVKAGLRAAAAGESVTAYTEGRYLVPKVASVCLLRGGRAYWDRVNGVATFAQPSGAFYLGRIVADAAAADTTVEVDFNVIVKDAISLLEGRWKSAAVLTAGAPAATRDAVGTGYSFTLDATAEAQKIDALSVGGVRTVDGPIFEGRMAIHTNGDLAAVTMFLGLANGTHATAFTSITQYCGFDFVGALLGINAISTDGTTTVAKTDTTLLAVLDVFQEFWIDARDPTNVKLYVDGVRVLASTVFGLAAATGPLLALLWLGKTVDDSVANVTLDFLRVRSSD